MQFDILNLNSFTYTTILFYEQANHTEGREHGYIAIQRDQFYKRRRKYKGPIFCKTGEGSLFSLAATVHMICQSVCAVFAQTSQNYCILNVCYFYFAFLRREVSPLRRIGLKMKPRKDQRIFPPCKRKSHLVFTSDSKNLPMSISYTVYTSTVYQS